MKYASCTFNEDLTGRQYTFANSEDLSLRHGDKVRVMTSRGEGSAYVIDPDIPAPAYTCQPILRKADTVPNAPDLPEPVRSADG